TALGAERRPPASIGSLAPLELDALRRFHALDGFRVREPGEKVLVDDRDAAGCDCANGEFRLPWRAQLAHDHHIEWCVKRLCNLESNRHAAAWQAQDQYVWLSLILSQQVGQFAACCDAIRKP